MPFLCSGNAFTECHSLVSQSPEQLLYTHLHFIYIYNLTFFRMNSVEYGISPQSYFKNSGIFTF